MTAFITPNLISKIQVLWFHLELIRIAQEAIFLNKQQNFVRDRDWRARSRNGDDDYHVPPPPACMSTVLVEGGEYLTPTASTPSLLLRQTVSSLMGAVVVFRETTLSFPGVLAYVAVTQQTGLYKALDMLDLTLDDDVEDRTAYVCGERIGPGVLEALAAYKTRTDDLLYCAKKTVQAKCGPGCSVESGLSPLQEFCQFVLCVCLLSFGGAEIALFYPGSGGARMLFAASGWLSGPILGFEVDDVCAKAGV
jgi:hypothetical protein